MSPAIWNRFKYDGTELAAEMLLCFTVDQKLQDRCLGCHMPPLFQTEKE